ncbi:SDR family oxidoreductase [Streptomyces flavidovirens]|uniref:SDR family oxidoreductase n=1 Tax=Streptomyces flavidovirens TaxID=67298 RepID=UPI00369DD868
MIDYAASKAALVTFTKSIAVHPAQRDVRANVVAPGPTWTNAAQRGGPAHAAGRTRPDQQRGTPGPCGTN